VCFLFGGTPSGDENPEGEISCHSNRQSEALEDWRSGAYAGSEASRSPVRKTVHSTNGCPFYGTM